MILYRVTDWEDHFENSRTREYKRLDWLPLPNKMDGDGYSQLVTLDDGVTPHPDRDAHFGGWCAILEVASKGDPRGTLWRDKGKPHDANSLARVTRLSLQMFEAVIPRLITIGWLTAENIEDNVVTTIPQHAAGKPQRAVPSVCAPARPQNGIELNGIEQNTHTPADAGRVVAQSGFDRFWAAWPKHERKTNRKACLKRWNSPPLEPLTEEILRGLNRWKASAPWAKESGQFIPAPLVWLTQERWTAADALDPAEKGQGDNGFVRAPFTREVAEAIGAPWPVVLADGTEVGA